MKKIGKFLEILVGVMVELAGNPEGKLLEQLISLTGGSFTSRFLAGF